MVSINIVNNIPFKGITKINKAREYGAKIVNGIAEMLDPDKNPAESSDIFDIAGQSALESRVVKTIRDTKVLKYRVDKIQESSKLLYRRAVNVITDVKGLAVGNGAEATFYDDNTGHNVIASGRSILEFDLSNNRSRETSLTPDGKAIERIEEKFGDTINIIERTETGIKIANGVHIYPNNTISARKILYFDHRGNLTDYIGNYTEKKTPEGETYYKSCDENYEFEYGKLRRATTGIKITPEKTTIDQDVCYSHTGFPKSICEKYIGKRGDESVGEKYAFSEEEIKVEDSINEYESAHRLLHYNGSKKYKTNLIFDLNGNLI